MELLLLVSGESHHPGSVQVPRQSAPAVNPRLAAARGGGSPCIVLQRL